MVGGRVVGGDGLDMLRAAVPGEPGLDYPVLSAVQLSAFTCEGLTTGGYYADPEQDIRCSKLIQVMKKHNFKSSQSSLL